jgi:hypothetical protein
MDASVDGLLDDLAGIVGDRHAASYLFIVGEIAPLRPRNDAMPLPESVKAVA